MSDTAIIISIFVLYGLAVAIAIVALVSNYKNNSDKVE